MRESWSSLVNHVLHESTEGALENDNQHVAANLFALLATRRLHREAPFAIDPLSPRGEAGRASFSPIASNHKTLIDKLTERSQSNVCSLHSRCHFDSMRHSIQHTELGSDSSITLRENFEAMYISNSLKSKTRNHHGDLFPASPKLGTWG